jgi:hypothetical protein
LLINLGEAVLKSPGASLRFIKKRFRQSEKGFEQQPVKGLLRKTSAYVDEYYYY